MNIKVNNWLNPKLQPGKSIIHGTGIIALEDISKDTPLAFFGGHVMTRSELEPLDPAVADLALGIEDGLFIGANSAAESDDGDWFNHSCDPNAGLVGQIKLVAMRDIKANEEITFDYVMCCSHIGEKVSFFKCNCGSPICRGEMTNQDWLRPDIQQRYKGYLSLFVQKNIEFLNHNNNN